MVPKTKTYKSTKIKINTNNDKKKIKLFDKKENDFMSTLQ